MTDELNRTVDGENSKGPSGEGDTTQFRYHDRGFFALIENISDLIVATDTTGKICYASPSVERVLGYLPHQVLRRNIFDFVHPQDVEPARESFERVAQTPGVSGPLTPLRARHRESGWHYVEAIGKRLTEGDTVVLSIRDITERMQTEEALRQSNNKLQLYFEQTKLGVIEWDRYSRISRWNQAAEKIFGYSAEDVVGRDITFLVPDGLKDFAENAGVWLMGDGNTGPFTNENVTQDGRTVICDWCNTRLTGADGKGIGIISLIEDVTDKLRAQEKELHSQRLEMIGTMASGLAHDLNNILSPVVMVSQALRYEVLSASGQMRLDTLDTCARRGLELVNHILSLARGTKMERTAVKSTELFSEMVSILQEVLPRTIQLKTVLPTDVWKIHGNPVELQQVLLNLCLNARDSMPGGGLMTLKARNILLSKGEASALGDLQPGAHVEWQISDTGSGIAAEHLHKIFDPFFTTKERGKGTGLGLAISQRIIQSHGGAVRVVSEVGVGTTFKVYFPVAHPPARTESGTEAKQ